MSSQFVKSSGHFPILCMYLMVGTPLRDYDHGLVSCDWQCPVKSQSQQVKHVDYLSLEKNDEAREKFDASVARHERYPVRFGQRLCQFGPPDEVCLRCGTRDTSRQATRTTQKMRSEPAHKNVVRRALQKLQQAERTGAPRIYSGSNLHNIQPRRLLTLRAQSSRRHWGGRIRWQHAFSDKADSYTRPQR